MNNKGFSILEVIIAAALFIIFATGIAQAVLGGFVSNRQGEEQTIASNFATEGMEAVRSINNQAYANLINSAATGVIQSGSVWAFSGLNNVFGKYTRVLTVADVQRDGGGNIVASGGTLDSNTKKATSTVSWNAGATRNVSVVYSTYLTNRRRIVLGNWAIPILDSSFDLTVANSGSATANAISVAYSNNYAYLGRATSGGTELEAIDVTNTASPSLCANCQRELGGDVNDIKISGNFAYMASSNNTQELQIINISSPTTLNAATLTTFNLTAGNSGNDNGDGLAIAISGNFLYMVRNGGNQLIKFDISTPTSPTIVGTSTAITGTPSDIEVVGNYAFVTSDDNAAELQVINLTTFARDAVLDLNSGNNNANALSVTYAGSNRLLIGRTSSAAPDLYSINILTPTSPTLASTLEVGAGVLSISFGNNLIFLATDDNANDFKVINGTNLDSLPILPPFGQLNIANSPVQIFYEPTIDRAFITNSNATEELEIIKPQ